MTSRADLPGTPASTGTSRQPRTVKSSSRSTFSTARTAGRDPRSAGTRYPSRITGRRKVEGHDRPEERVGDLDRDPAPSPVSASAPAAPRWFEAAHRGERLLGGSRCSCGPTCRRRSRRRSCRARIGVVQTLFLGQIAIAQRSRPRSRMVRSAVHRRRVSGHRGTTLARRRARRIVAVSGATRPFNSVRRGLPGPIAGRGRPGPGRPPPGPRYGRGRRRESPGRG